MYNTVDVMGWDRAKPTHAYLSTGFIALLEQRGVPNDFFTKLAQKEIDELLSISKDYRRLFDRYSARAFLRDSSCIFDDDILLRMLQANVPLNEPMMLHKVNKFIKDELRLFKEKVWSCFRHIILQLRYHSCTILVLYMLLEQISSERKQVSTNATGSYRFT